jgi:hypothetical protein
MKKLTLLITFIIATSTFAENSRSPAVLDGTCKEISTERAVSDILKDQCKAVKKCMFSANEEDMDELKSLEAVACNNNMNAVTTKTPGSTIDKNFNGRRKAKFDSHEQPSIQTTTVTPTNIAK